MKAQGAGPAGAPATESVEDLERASKNGTGGQRRAVEGGGGGSRIPHGWNYACGEQSRLRESRSSDARIYI
jgi:hypothetical protein